MLNFDLTAMLLCSPTGQSPSDMSQGTSPSLGETDAVFTSALGSPDFADTLNATFNPTYAFDLPNMRDPLNLNVPLPTPQQPPGALSNGDPQTWQRLMQLYNL